MKSRKIPLDTIPSMILAGGFVVSIGLVAIKCVDEYRNSHKDQILPTNIRAVETYVVQGQPYNMNPDKTRTMFLFDMNGDKTIDQVVETRGIECRSLSDLTGIPKQNISFFASEKTFPDEWVIKGIIPQPLTPEYAQLAQNFLRPLHSK